MKSPVNHCFKCLIVITKTINSMTITITIIIVIFNSTQYSPRCRRKTKTIILVFEIYDVSQKTSKYYLTANHYGCIQELALMYKSRRTATVRCQEDVELLAVAREDFVDIFMHVERDVEPEHVTFLRSLHVLRSWPVEVLPANNPRILVFTYVRCVTFGKS